MQPHTQSGVYPADGRRQLLRRWLGASLISKLKLANGILRCKNYMMIGFGLGIITHTVYVPCRLLPTSHFDALDLDRTTKKLTKYMHILKSRISSANFNVASLKCQWSPQKFRYFHQSSKTERVIGFVWKITPYDCIVWFMNHAVSYSLR